MIVETLLVITWLLASVGAGLAVFEDSLPQDRPTEVAVAVIFMCVTWPLWTAWAIVGGTMKGRIQREVER